MKPPPVRHVYGEDVGLTAELSAHAFGTAFKPLVATDPIELLQARVTNLEALVDTNRKVSDKRHEMTVHALDEHDRRIGETDGRLTEELRRLREETREIIAGPNGKGLNFATVGILLTIVGTALTFS